MIEALSAALFHFLWQGVALTLIPALALLCRSPRVRYAAACAALFAMPVALVVTFAISIPAAGSHIAIPIQLHAAPVASAPAAPVSRPFDFENSMRWFVPFWAAGVALFYLRTFVAWIAVQRLRRSSSVAAPEFWRMRIVELSTRLGIRRAVALFSSTLVDVPVVAGFLRPVIFVPAALFTGMPVDQLEYLLIHELAHIRRFDYAVNLLQKAVEGLLFYHPAVWWVSRILRTERENCCDDAVVELRGNAREYARVLATLERHRSAPALAASGGHLGKRIVRLLNRPGPSSSAPVFGLLAIAVTATMAWAALQQPAAIPQVAPKPADAPSFWRWLDAGGADIHEAEPPAANPQEIPLQGAYQKWINEDVPYIIEDSERKAYKALTTDAERDHFIEQFWARRDPTPGTPQNEMKEEHYRRIAYVNQRFTGTIPGWKTDRGRIYITFGPPDEIDSHPGDATPWEQWKYRWIEGIGTSVMIDFQDRGHNGNYYMTMDPAAAQPEQKRVVVEQTPKGINVNIVLNDANNFNVFVRVTTEDRRPVTTTEKVVLRQAGLQLPIELKPGTYRVSVVAKNVDSAAIEIQETEFPVIVP